LKAEKRILLIEDDHEQALLFKQLLSLSVENECQITHKDTLAHSLEYLRKNTPNAILLDLDLSDNRGLEALDKVRAQAHGIPIVVLSDLERKETALEAIKRGAQDYLHKNTLTGPILSRVMCYAIERQELSNALLQQQENLGRVLGSITDSVWSADIIEGELNYQYYSPVVEQITGYPREHFMSGLEAWSQIVHPEDRELFLNKVKQEFLGEIVEHKYRIIRADGQVRWVSGKTSPTLGADNTVVHLNGIISDITEHHEATELLHQQSIQQAAVANFSQQALIEHDLQTLMDEATSLAAKVLNVEYTKVLKLLSDNKQLLLCSGVGWKPGLVGHRKVDAGKKSQAGYTPLTEKPIIITDFQTEDRFTSPPLLAEHNVVSGISVGIPGGEKNWGIFGVHTSELRNYTSDEIHFISALANTLGSAIAHQNTIKALQSRETQYRTLFETTKEGIIISTPDSTILSINPAAAAMLGYDEPADLIGTSSTLLYQNPKSREPMIKSLMENGYFYDRELVLKKADGTRLHALASAVMKKDEQGNPAQLEGFFVDITKRKEAEENLILFANAAEQTADSVIITDTQGVITYVNHAFEELTGYSQREAIGERPSLLKSDKHNQAFFETLWKTILSDEPFRAQFINRRKNGELYYEFKTITPITNEKGKITHFVSTGKDITKSKLAEVALRESEERYRTVADFTYDWEVWIAPDGTYKYSSPSSERITGYKPKEFEKNKNLLLELVHPKDKKKVEKHFKHHFSDEEVIPIEFRIIKHDGKECWIEHVCQPVYGSKKNWLGRRASNRDITDRKRGEEMIRELNRISLGLKYTFSEEQIFEIVAKGLKNLRLTCGISFLGEEENKLFFKYLGFSTKVIKAAEKVTGLTVEEFSIDVETVPLYKRAISEKKSFFQENVEDHVRLLLPKSAKKFASQITKILKIPKAIISPLFVEDDNIGLLSVQSQELREADLPAINAFAHQLSLSLENARLYKQTQQRLKRLSTLHTVDVAIAGSLDLRVTLDVLLNEISSQLGVDAANILLFNPQTQSLEFKAARGFRTSALQHTYLRIGDGQAGGAALKREIVHIVDLREQQTTFSRSPQWTEEGFVSYFGIPLIAKGKVQGVLEIFHRSILKTDTEWLNFLKTLANQAAIAIDNTSLFNDMQRANDKLTLTYDITLEGWAKALELRDMETEGHSRRVTDITVRIARAVGMSDQELVHTRRGALLHDIGKMGIPDSILHKPGKLTPEEWETMKQHPVYAYNLLTPIEYLQPAIDIPYCHHEKWDGSGYPRGLKEKEIPLAARIFAIVDVWDALLSDRPYRKGWSEEKVLAYIRENSGTHFDPRLVDIFIETVVGNSARHP
jgi:PAS domain S-box-containing protein